MKKLLTVLLLTFILQVHAQVVPTFEQVLSLRGVGGQVMSGDGKQIAFTIQTTDLELKNKELIQNQP